MQLPLLMVPTGDRWSFPADACFALAEEWIDGALAGPDLPALVRRHLGAFGPASAADVQVWSGLKGLKDVVDGMAGELVELHGTAGRRSTTSPARRGPTRTRPRRRGCSRSSTACCSPIRTARA